MTPQEEEHRAKENLTSIIRNIQAMPTEDRLGMIEVLLEIESPTPVKIQTRQVGANKLMTRTQLLKRLHQFSPEEQEEIGLLIRQDSKSTKVATPVQIHTLQLPKKQKEPSTTQSRALKAKRSTKVRIKECLLRHNQQEMKEIALESLKGIPEEQLMPTARKLRQSTKPVVMGNLSIPEENLMSRESRTMNMIARIRATTTGNLTRGRRIAVGYVQMAARIEERAERKIDEELTQNAQKSQKIKWDHRTVTQQLTKLQKQAQKDPELGPQKLTAYKLEC